MEARDGLEGLTKAEFRKPDLILLDLMMPDVSGGRMFDEMRHHPATKDIPIVVVTGKPDAHEMFDDAIGEDNVIMKPFEADALIGRIRVSISATRSDRRRHPGLPLGPHLRKLRNGCALTASRVRETIVTGRSKCPNCGRQIKAHENIPVVSYLVLRGKCPGCDTRISLRYPLTELATGVLFALSVVKFDVSVTAVVYAVFFWVLVVLTVIDLEHRLLPNRIVYPTFVVGWAGLVAAALIDGDTSRLRSAALGAVVFGGFFFVVAFIYPAGMGMGDVKLAFVLGTFVGYGAALERSSPGCSCRFSWEE